MQSISVEREIGGRKLIIETGTLAKLAHGSVTVQYGETVVFGAVVRAAPREGIDFFPLQVEYRERRAAVGKFPGGFMKREGRPTTKEILTSRLVDRPLRPLFPKGFYDEVQVHLTVLAADQKHDPDVLAGIAASAAVAISDVPFLRPIAHVRVGRVDGQFIIFPTTDDLAKSELDLVVAGTRNHVNMIEVGAREASEEVVAAGIEFGHKYVIQIVEMIEELIARAGRPKVGEFRQTDPALLEEVRRLAADRIRAIKGQPGKQDRAQAIDALLEEVVNQLSPLPTDPSTPYLVLAAARERQKAVREAFVEIEEQVTRQAILEGIRPDGRGCRDIRPVTCEVGVLPRVHGSALFTRGETQALCTVTLGTSEDQQLVDGLLEEYAQRFMLHYYFPSYSVGEVRPIRGPGRREIGHGALAERSLEPVLPSEEQFAYTIRIISDILESNGSSSMASSCGGCLALMDAGVPITKPVAGISIGMVQEGDRRVLLTDIIGEEDRFGDMDFKVCGTRDGITAIQLDIKTEGLSYDVIREALDRAREGRMVILDKMTQTLPAPRPQISPWAPKLVIVKIDTEMIGKLIGSGGKVINRLQDETGATIEVEDDGTVYISSVDAAAVEKARSMVEAITGRIEVGKTYTGKVVSIREFGAFVEIAPETDGLVHVSELSDQYVAHPEDVVKVGDEVRVKCILIDEQGRIKLSRKAVLKDEGRSDPAPATPQPARNAPRRPGPPQQQQPPGRQPQPQQQRFQPRPGQQQPPGGGRGNRGARGGRSGRHSGHERHDDAD